MRFSLSDISAFGWCLVVVCLAPAYLDAQPPPTTVRAKGHNSHAKQTPVVMRRYLRKPPAGFVDLRTFIPGIRLAIGYHTRDNFTGAPLPGYGAPGAWMLQQPAEALKKVQADAKARGLSLLVYDAYRPVRATLAMVAWAKRTNQMKLFRDGYIARYSGHNHGHTIDLTLVVDATGTPLDMGTPWDTLNPSSHTRNAKGLALRNRLLLRTLMRRHGFRPYFKEWWHFGYRVKSSRRRDVPYGCFEPDEGSWKPPTNWNDPQFNMPLRWTPTPCSTHDKRPHHPSSSSR